jgi:hypothetical protein
MEDPNLQKNRKIQGSDQPARAAAKARSRASRRMRTATAWPSCFETHRSALRLWKHLRSRPAAMLLSMRARVRGSSPRKRGPMITAGGYGSRLSLRSAGTTNRLSKAPTCGCARWRPGQFHCFGIVIYNESCNSNVSGRRGRCVTPYVTHDVAPSVVIMCFEFDAPMPSLSIRSNPPPGPRPR